MIPDLIAIFVIAVLCCAPIILWIVGLHSLARHPQLQRHLNRRRENHSPHALEPFSSGESMLLQWITPANYLGDTSCRFNAHSPFLRCAVNPTGPCQGCSCYELSQHLSPRSDQAPVT